MFGKNSVVHTILFTLALLIILYGAYNALFGNVEGLGKKKLTKICSDISNCGPEKYDFNDKSIRKAFKKEIKKERKVCKQECKSDYEGLGYSSKKKCKRKMCKTKDVATRLLEPPTTLTPPGGDDDDEDGPINERHYIKYKPAGTSGPGIEEPTETDIKHYVNNKYTTIDDTAENIEIEHSDELKFELNFGKDFVGKQRPKIIFERAQNTVDAKTAEMIAPVDNKLLYSHLYLGDSLFKEGGSWKLYIYAAPSTRNSVSNLTLYQVKSDGTELRVFDADPIKSAENSEQMEKLLSSSENLDTLQNNWELKKNRTISFSHKKDKGGIGDVTYNIKFDMIQED